LLVRSRYLLTAGFRTTSGGSMPVAENQVQEAGGKKPEARSQLPVAS
jgi:hypothetical protein